MVSNYYCQDCDKNINLKYKQHHIKSKSHSYMYYNIKTNKYIIGDVCWVDFEKRCMSISKKIIINSILFLSLLDVK